MSGECFAFEKKGLVPDVKTKHSPLIVPIIDYMHIHVHVPRAIVADICWRGAPAPGFSVTKIVLDFFPPTHTLSGFRHWVGVQLLVICFLSSSSKYLSEMRVSEHAGKSCSPIVANRPRKKRFSKKAVEILHDDDG